MMNVVNAGNRYQIYGEDVKTFKRLPIASYEVNFNKMTGFYLTSRPDLIANEDKIYGNHEKKVEKVMHSFQMTDRNFGIILSGQKGIGKSLFARILATKSIATGYPVITVNNYIPGIADFLGSIEQEVVVIFDEFEKTFGAKEEFDPQEEMLSLFDGMNNGKKLFVITCNEVEKLNSYLINRPGRFHYHFNIQNPSDEEVYEYMCDKVKPEYHEKISQVTNLAKTINITYDYLRAIAFELNQGYNMDEILTDLNITRTSDVRFDLLITLQDGRVCMAYGQSIDLYDKKDRWYDAYCEKGQRIRVHFKPCDISFEANRLRLNGTKCERYVDPDDFWHLPDEEREAKYEYERNCQVKDIIFQKCDYSVIERFKAV